MEQQGKPASERAHMCARPCPHLPRHKQHANAADGRRGKQGAPARPRAYGMCTQPHLQPPRQHICDYRSAPEPVTNHSLLGSNATERTQLRGGGGEEAAGVVASRSARRPAECEAQNKGEAPCLVGPPVQQGTLPMHWRATFTAHALASNIHCPCTGKQQCSSHPRWPEITRYMRQGACHAGRGHLLGRRRASVAEGVYSLCGRWRRGEGYGRQGGGEEAHLLLRSAPPVSTVHLLRTSQ